MSTNSLLSRSNLKPEASPAITHKARTNKLTPCWRYHKEFGAKLLKYDDELQWLGDGWVDHPGKLCRLPGHEKLYDCISNPVSAKQNVSESAYIVKSSEDIEQQSKDAEDAAALKLKNEAIERAKEIRANPTIHACPDCDQKFDNPRRLHMHRIARHKYRETIVTDSGVVGEPKC